MPVRIPQTLQKAAPACSPASHLAALAPPPSRTNNDTAKKDELTTSPLSLSLLQAYNSIFNADPNPPRLIGNFPLLPLRTKTRGPAYTLPLPNPPLPAHESPDPESDSYDALDEVLSLFRANTFFRNFEIQGPADRLLIYGILFVSEALSKIRPAADVRQATKDVMNLALDTNFAVPGDPAFPLNQVCQADGKENNRGEGGKGGWMGVGWHIC